MGYYIREGMVDEHAATLNEIHTAIGQGRSLSFQCKRPKEMSKMKYQFNRILRATQILTTEAGGKFTNLRQRVQVQEDWSNMRIVVAPKLGSSLVTELKPVMPDEKDMLVALESSDGEGVEWVKFTPSSDYDFEEFKKQVEARGFELATHVETGEVVILDGSDDEIIMTANRKKRAGTSSMLQELGFGRTE